MFQLSSNDIEKIEEAKLRAKFPNTGRPISGHSAFLQKRLAKGVKISFIIIFVYLLFIIILLFKYL